MKKTPPDEHLSSFAKKHPLPKRPEQMAEALLDLAALFFSNNDLPDGSELDLRFVYRDYAPISPGAFLSNPAILPSTRTPGFHGPSLGSLNCGFLFSYSHYQANTLGPALLLCASSPRHERPAAAPKLYAQALILLLERGQAARVDDLPALTAIAEGRTPRSQLRQWNFSYGFDAISVARLKARGIVSPRSAECVKLGLEDTSVGLFSTLSRKKLEALSARALATQEAHDILDSVSSTRCPFESVTGTTPASIRL